MNDQRHVIFSQRNEVMNNDKIFSYSDDFLNEIVENLCNLKNKYLTNPKNNEFINQTKLLLGKSLNEEEIESLINIKNEEFEKKIKQKFITKRNERINYLEEKNAKEIEKRIFLQSIDLNWKSHIQYLEQLRQVIGLRSYGQRDPLIEYKKEAFTLFENLLNKLKKDLITILLNLTIVEKQKNKVNEIKPIKTDPKLPEKKMRRNEPCFCGSGKKFKHCCGSLR